MKFVIHDDAVNRQAVNLAVTVDGLQEALERYRAAVAALPGAWLGAGAATFQTFEQRYEATSRGLATSLETIRAEVDAAGLDYARNEADQKAAVEALRPEWLGWEAGASIEDNIGNNVAGPLGELPVLEDHPEWTRSAVWAFMAAPALLGAGLGVLKGKRYFTNLSALRAAQGLPTNFRALFGPGPRPPAPTWANSSTTRSVLSRLLGSNAQRVFNVLDHPVVAGTTPSESLLRGGLRTLPQRAGLVRGLGVVGGVASTGASLANVAAQGWPWDAIQNNGVDYVADVAELGFNASMTALMVAPSPWTAGAVAVTGLAYGVTEVVAHWDEITTFVGETVDVAGELVGEAADTIGNAAEAVGDTIGNAAETVGDTIGDVADTLNPFN